MDAFIEYYENHHIPLICSLAPPPTVYKRRYLVRGEGIYSRRARDFGMNRAAKLQFSPRLAATDPTSSPFGLRC